MLIHLDKDRNQDVIEAIADLRTTRVIFLDEGFRGNDELKINAVQTFKSLAHEEESVIVFPMMVI